MHELELLRAIEREFVSTDDTHGVADLKRLNETLWEIEDAIRDCERREDFGAEFIRLARSIYKINDKRAAIKRAINALHNSAIVEQKSYSPYER